MLTFNENGDILIFAYNPYMQSPNKGGGVNNPQQQKQPGFFKKHWKGLLAGTAALGLGALAIANKDKIRNFINSFKGGQPQQPTNTTPNTDASASTQGNMTKTSAEPDPNTPTHSYGSGVLGQNYINQSSAQGDYANVETGNAIHSQLQKRSKYLDQLQKDYETFKQNPLQWKMKNAGKFLGPQSDTEFKDAISYQQSKMQDLENAKSGKASQMGYGKIFDPQTGTMIDG